MSFDQMILKRIENLEQNKGNTMSETNIDVPDLTENKEVNNQLIMYFWWLILLSFASQLIGYLIQYFSGTITLIVLGILALGSVNTLLIGGGVKLVQKQIQAVTDKYNQSVKQKKVADETIASLSIKLADLEKQLVNRDAELIAIKTTEKKV
jgi:hypothetical protein